MRSTRRFFRSRTSGPGSGWTVIEVLLSTVLLLTVVVGFAYGLASSTSLGIATKQLGLASEAARAQLEVLRATAFGEVLARYDARVENDPASGSSPGASFDVAGLAASPVDADGHVGEIVFPLDDDGALREDLELMRLGMPRDLSGEGEIDELDHSGDYRLLPVLVRLRWRGAAGDATFELATVLKRMHP